MEDLRGEVSTTIDFFQELRHVAGDGSSDPPINAEGAARDETSGRILSGCVSSPLAMSK